MQGKPTTGARLDASHPINAGLVAFWPFDERGGQAVRDIRGVNRGACVNAPAWSGIGGELKFVRASSQYVNCGNNASVQLSGKFTISCWFWMATNPTTTPGNYAGIVVKGYDGTNTGFQLNLQNDATTGSNSAIIVASYDGASSTAHGTSFVVSGNVSLSRWYHLVATQDGVTWRLYLNGVQMSSSTDSTGALSTSKSLLIGAADFGAIYPFDGYVENVRVYNRGLSRNEVELLYVQPWAGLVRKHRRVLVNTAAEPANLGGFLVFM
jgi:hypothetical protein